MRQQNIIVIGTSAGGLEALLKVLKPIKNTIPASIFIVQHLAPTSSSEIITEILQKSTELTCKVAEHEEEILTGYVYTAQVDQHMLLKDGHILLTRGARENGFRPAIDATLRSAAAYYGSNAIGVILTGMLHDGIVGMEAIKRAGGITVVQDPEEADFAELPRNVLQHMEVDYCIPTIEIGILLQELAYRKANKQTTIPEDIKAEALIVERMLTQTEHVEQLGDRSVFTCPDCGGSLWEMNHGNVLRYRCHSGHAVVAEALLLEKDKALEETLWIALRILEERRNMLLSLVNQHASQGRNAVTALYQEKMEEAQRHIDRIRSIVLTDTSSNPALQEEQHIDKKKQHT